MNSRAETVILLAILTVAAVALGFTFDGAGLGAASSKAVVQTASVSTTTGQGPHFLVKAEAAEASSGPPTLSNGSSQSYSFVPILGLRLVLVGLEVGPLTRLGRPLTYFVFTNSTGEGEIAVAPGNFTVSTAGADFNYTSNINFIGNKTTVLELQVVPTYSRVLSLEVMNQDTTQGVEPTAKIYAEVQGTPRLDSSSVYEIMGIAPGTSVFSGPTGITFSIGAPVNINATASGTYSAPGGTWVIMSPAQYYPEFPVSNVFLLRLVTNSTVTYIGP